VSTQGEHESSRERTLVASAEVVAELRVALLLDLGSQIDQLRISAEDAKRALEAGGLVGLASRGRRFPALTVAIDARRELHDVVGWPGQPDRDTTLNGEWDCGLALDVCRLTSFLSCAGIDSGRVGPIDLSLDRNGR
jgi:hypothetical protein